MDNSKIPPAPAGFQERVIAKKQQTRAEDAAGHAALTAPFPGATRNVWAVKPDIECGPHKVRPFRDRDWQTLEIIDHPVNKMKLDAMKGNAEPSSFLPNDAPALQFIYLLTHPSKEVFNLVQAEGVKGLNEAIAKEDMCGDMDVAQLAELCKAGFEQLSRYWLPAVGYTEPEPEPKKGEAAKAKPNPPLSVLPLTVLDGEPISYVG